MYGGVFKKSVESHLPCYFFSSSLPLRQDSGLCSDSGCTACKAGADAVFSFRGVEYWGKKEGKKTHMSLVAKKEGN